MSRLWPRSWISLLLPSPTLPHPIIAAMAMGGATRRLGKTLPARCWVGLLLCAGLQVALGACEVSSRLARRFPCSAPSAAAGQHTAVARSHAHGMVLVIQPLQPVPREDVSMQQAAILSACCAHAAKQQRLRVLHPGGNPGGNRKSISHRCYLFEVAFVWESTNDTIDLLLGCLQGGVETQLAPPGASTARRQNNYFTERCSGAEEGSYLRLIDFCITQVLQLRGGGSGGEATGAENDNAVTS